MPANFRESALGKKKKRAALGFVSAALLLFIQGVFSLFTYSTTVVVRSVLSILALVPSVATELPCIFNTALLDPANLA